MNLPRWLTANLLSGALVLLAYPPLNVYWLGFVCFAPHLVFLAQESHPKRLALGVWLFQSILLVGRGYYFFEPIFYCANLLLVAGLIPVTLMAQAFMARVRQRSARVCGLVAVIAGCYLGFEWFQAQFSFLPLVAGASGASLGHSPFVGLARFGGLRGLSLFVVMINAICAWGWLASHQDKTKRAGGRISQKLLAAGGLNGAVLGAGLLLSQHVVVQQRAAYLKKPHAVTIAAVSVSRQFAKDTQFFWDSDTSQALIDVVSRDVGSLKEALHQHPGKPDLIIFPEDMIDIEFWGRSDPQARERFTITNAGPLIALYRTVSQELHASLLFVLTTLEQAGRFNSALLLDPSGSLVTVSHKRDLAIALEYWPFGRFHPWYIDWRMDEEARVESPIYNPAYQYLPGDSIGLFHLTQGATFGAPICIEIHYPDHVRAAGRQGAQFLSNTSSNMSMEYGLRTYLELTLNLRRIEAVWLHLPIIFCGRRDYAGMVFPDGHADFLGLDETEPFRIYYGSVRF